MHLQSDIDSYRKKRKEEPSGVPQERSQSEVAYGTHILQVYHRKEKHNWGFRTSDLINLNYISTEW